MKRIDFLVVKGLFLALILTLGCNEQHDPSEHHKQIRSESDLANRNHPKLTDKGTIPGAEDNKVDISQKYAQLCASCHGASGAGDGAGGAALAVKPRNLTDKAWQASVDDERIATVIAKGGPAVGLDAGMAAWGAILTDEEVALMVGYVRQLGQ